MQVALSHWPVFAVAAITVLIVSTTLAVYGYWTDRENSEFSYSHTSYTPVAGVAVAVLFLTVATALGVFFAIDDFTQANLYERYLAQSATAVSSNGLDAWDYQLTADGEQWTGTEFGGMCWIQRWSLVTGAVESGMVNEPCDLAAFAAAPDDLNFTLSDTTPFKPNMALRIGIVAFFVIMGLIFFGASQVMIVESVDGARHDVAKVFVPAHPSRHHRWSYTHKYFQVLNGHRSPDGIWDDTKWTRTTAPTSDDDIKLLQDISRRLSFTWVSSSLVTATAAAIGLFAGLLAIAAVFGLLLVFVRDPLTSVDPVSRTALLLVTYAVAAAIARVLVTLASPHMLSRSSHRFCKAVDDACALVDAALPSTETRSPSSMAPATAFAREPQDTPVVPESLKWKAVLWIAGESRIDTATRISRQLGHSATAHADAIARLQAAQDRCHEAIEHTNRAPKTMREHLLCVDALAEPSSDVFDLIGNITALLHESGLPHSPSRSESAPDPA